MVDFFKKSVNSILITLMLVCNFSYLPVSAEEPTNTTVTTETEHEEQQELEKTTEETVQEEVIEQENVQEDLPSEQNSEIPQEVEVLGQGTYEKTFILEPEFPAEYENDENFIFEEWENYYHYEIHTVCDEDIDFSFSLATGSSFEDEDYNYLSHISFSVSPETFPDTEFTITFPEEEINAFRVKEIVLYDNNGNEIEYVLNGNSVSFSASNISSFNFFVKEEKTGPFTKKYVIEQDKPADADDSWVSEYHDEIFVETFEKQTLNISRLENIPQSIDNLREIIYTPVVGYNISTTNREGFQTSILFDIDEELDLDNIKLLNYRVSTNFNEIPFTVVQIDGKDYIKVELDKLSSKSDSNFVFATTEPMFEDYSPAAMPQEYEVTPDPVQQGSLELRNIVFKWQSGDPKLKVMTDSFPSLDFILTFQVNDSFSIKSEAIEVALPEWIWLDKEGNNAHKIDLGNIKPYGEHNENDRLAYKVENNKVIIVVLSGGKNNANVTIEGSYRPVADIMDVASLESIIEYDYMGESDKLYAAISIANGNNSVFARTDYLLAQLHKTITVTQVTKDPKQRLLERIENGRVFPYKEPIKVSSVVPEALVNVPENPSDYLYGEWVASFSIKSSEPYDINIIDTLGEENGIVLQIDEISTEPANPSEIVYEDDSRQKVVNKTIRVISAYPKEHFDPLVSHNFNNTIKVEAVGEETGRISYKEDSAKNSYSPPIITTEALAVQDPSFYRRYNGTHTDVLFYDTVKISDKVNITNLQPSTSYKLVTKVVNKTKSTADNLVFIEEAQCDDIFFTTGSNETTVRKYASVQIPSSSLRSGDQVVLYQYLYADDIEISRHSSLTDVNQTVSYVACQLHHENEVTKTARVEFDYNEERYTATMERREELKPTSLNFYSNSILFTPTNCGKGDPYYTFSSTLPASEENDWHVEYVYPELNSNTHTFSYSDAKVYSRYSRNQELRYVNDLVREVITDSYTKTSYYVERGWKVKDFYTDANGEYVLVAEYYEREYASYPRITKPSYSIEVTKSNNTSNMSTLFEKYVPSFVGIKYALYDNYENAKQGVNPIAIREITSNFRRYNSTLSESSYFRTNNSLGQNSWNNYIHASPIAFTNLDPSKVYYVKEYSTNEFYEPSGEIYAVAFTPQYTTGYDGKVVPYGSQIIKTYFVDAPVLHNAFHMEKSTIDPRTSFSYSRADSDLNLLSEGFESTELLFNIVTDYIQTSYSENLVEKDNPLSIRNDYVIKSTWEKDQILEPVTIETIDRPAISDLDSYRMSSVKFNNIHEDDQINVFGEINGEFILLASKIEGQYQVLYNDVTFSSNKLTTTNSDIKAFKTEIITVHPREDVSQDVGVVILPSEHMLNEVLPDKIDVGYGVYMFTNHAESCVKDKNGNITKNPSGKLNQRESRSSQWLHGVFYRTGVDINKESSVFKFNEETVEYVSTQKLTLNQITNTSDKLTYEELYNDNAIPISRSGTFVDLIPEGMTVDVNSFVCSGCEIIEFTAEPNYKNSGKTILKVMVNITKEPSRITIPQVYDNEKYRSQDVAKTMFPAFYYGEHTYGIVDVSLSFDLRYSIGSQITWGFDRVNLAAYIADEDKFGNLRNFKGEPDSPEGNHRNSYELSPEEKEVLTDLSGDSVLPNTIYTKANMDGNKKNISNVSHIEKHVNAMGEQEWANHLSERTQAVPINGHYAYRLQMEGTYYPSSDIVFFDNLENYAPIKITDPGDSDWEVGSIIPVSSYTSTNAELVEYGYLPAVGEPIDVHWKGTIDSIDLSSARSLGCEPVVYYSTQDIDPKILDGMSITEILAYLQSSDWTTTPEDMSQVKTLAFDLTKKPDGSPFELEYRRELQIYINMISPDYFGNEEFFDSEEYTNYLKNTYAYNMASSHHKQLGFDYYTEDEYTPIGIYVPEIKVKKFWDDVDNNDGMRPESFNVDLVENGVTIATATLTKENNYEDILNFNIYNPDGTLRDIEIVEPEIEGYVRTDSTYRKISNTNIEMTVTNKHVPIRIDIPFEKTWDTDYDIPGWETVIPSVVTFKLYDGNVVLNQKQLRKQNFEDPTVWSGTFENLLKYRNGEEIPYIVKEVVNFDSFKEEQIDATHIKNTYFPYGDLQFNKYVPNDSPVNDNKQYTFKLSLTDYNNESDPSEYEYDILNTETKEVISNGKIFDGGEFSITKHQTIVFKKIPIYTTYKIEELMEFAPGYTVTRQSNTTGKTSSNRITVSSITNSYDASASISLSGRKTLENKELLNNEFTFSVTDEKKVTRNYTNTQAGTISLGTYTFDYKQHNKPVEILVKETNKTLSHIDYDNKEYIVKLTPIDNGDGTMSITKEVLLKLPEYDECIDSLNEHREKLSQFESLLAFCTNPEAEWLTNSETGDKYLEYSAISNPDYISTVISSFNAEKNCYLITENDIPSIEEHIATLTSFVEELEAMCYSIPESISFNNVYHATGTENFNMYKTIQAPRVLEEDEFSFILLDSEGNIISDSYMDDKGVISFPNGEQTYTEADIGKTYYYFVKELSSTDNTVYTDSNIYGYAVRISDNGDGTLSTEKRVINGNNAFIPSQDTESGLAKNPNFIPQPAYSSPVFNNKLTEGHLVLKKEIYGDETDDPDRIFEFTVTIRGDKYTDKTTFSSNITRSGDDSRKYIVRLKAGEEARFSYLPNGSTFIISENVPKKWILLEQTNASGIIYSTQTVESVFINKYEPNMTQAQLYGTKLFDNLPASEGSFSFELYENNELLQTTTVLDGGLFQFAPIVYEEPGIHTYVIKEVIGDDEDIEYDAHEETVTVTVDYDESNTLFADIVYDEDGASFENITRPGKLEIKKNVDVVSEANKDKDFTVKITLTNENGVPISGNTNVYYYILDENGNPKVEQNLLGQFFSMLTGKDPSIQSTEIVQEDLTPYEVKEKLEEENRSSLFTSINADGEEVIIDGGTYRGLDWKIVEKDYVYTLHLSALGETQTFTNTNVDDGGTTSQNETAYPWTLVKVPGYSWNILPSINSIVIDGNIKVVGSMYRMFAGFSGLTSFSGLEKIDTSQVEDMGSLFNGTSVSYNDIDVDLTSWDVSNVKMMYYVFENFKANSLNISTWDTSSAENMDHFFGDHWTNSLYPPFKTIVIGPKFKLKGNIANNGDISAYNGNPGYWSNWPATYYLNLDTNETYTENEKYLDGTSQLAGTWVYKPYENRNVDGTWWYVRGDTLYIGNTTEEVTVENPSLLPSELSNKAVPLDSIKHIKVGPHKTHLKNSMSQMFRGFISLETADLKGLDIYGVTSMESMFRECVNGENSVLSVDLSGLDTTNVTTMKYMFRDSRIRNIIGLDTFNVKYLYDAQGMFQDCDTNVIDLSTWNTLHLRNVANMFEGSDIRVINVRNWNTRSVVNFSYMFKNVTTKELDLSSFEAVGTGINYTTPAGTRVNQNSSKVNLSGLLSSAQTEIVDVSGFNMGEQYFPADNTHYAVNRGVRVDRMPNFLNNNANLKEITFGPNFKFGIGGSSNLRSGDWLYLTDGSVHSSNALLTQRFDTVEHAANYYGTYVFTKQLRLDPNGGYLFDDVNPWLIELGSQVKFPDGTLVVYPGYELIGWTKNAEDTSIPEISLNTLYNEEDLEGTYYAVWRQDGKNAVVARHNLQTATLNGFYYDSGTLYRDFPGETVTVSPEVFPGFHTEDVPQEITLPANDSEDNPVVVQFYYSRNLYTVSFDGNGADSGSMKQVINAVGGISSRVPKNSFNKKKAIFMGWNTEPDGSGIDVQDGGTFMNLGAHESNVVLYAQWKENDTNASPSNGVIYVTLKQGETLVIPDLPYKTKYQIEEINIPSGFSLESITGDADENHEGSIQANSLSSVNIDNTYKASGSFVIDLQKKLIGRNPNNAEFTFALLDSENYPILLASNANYDPQTDTAPAKFTVSGFTEKDIGKEFTYYIEEYNKINQEITYDDSKYMIKAVVEDSGNGTLQFNITKDVDDILFTNKMKPGNIKISKDIMNATENAENTEFNFKLSLTEANETPYNSPLTAVRLDRSTEKELETFIVKNGDTFAFSSDEVIIIKDIPSGINYALEELESPGWENVSKENEEGVIVANATAEVLFTNNYSSVGAAELEFTKTLYGPALVESMFEFELYDSENNLISTTRNDAEGKFKFYIDFTQDDVGKRFEYKIIEKQDYVSENTMLMDEHEVKVFIKVVDDGKGVITPQIEFDGEQNFLNIEHADLLISKEVSGNMGDKSEDFNFTITFDGDWDKHPITYQKLNSRGEVEEGTVESETFDFTLSHEENIKFIGIVTGVTYQITEAKDYNYYVEVVGADIVRKADDKTVVKGVSGTNKEITFNNNLSVAVPTEIRALDYLIPAAIVLLVAILFVAKKRFARN